MELIGFIRNASVKDGTISKGKRAGQKWYKYDAQIVTAEGQATQVSFGFDKPSVTEGDYVYCVANDENGFLTVDQSTIQRREAPVLTQKQEEKQAAPEVVENGVNRKTHPEDARRITYASARSTAIEMVNVLLTHKALPSSVAEGKTGATKRFDESMAAVDKLTVQYFNDAMTLRRLETVADTPPTAGKLSEHQKLPDDSDIDKKSEVRSKLDD